MPHQQKKSGLLLMGLRIFLYVLLLLILVYGILTMTLGFAEQHRIRKAAANGLQTDVVISEIQELDGQIIVVMQPDHNADKRIGRTISPTTNRKLKVGDHLTMYYGDNNVSERVVDFKTARPMIRTGSILTVGALIGCAVTGIVHLRQHRRKK